jgi:hypothetical protein
MSHVVGQNWKNINNFAELNVTISSTCNVLCVAWHSHSLAVADTSMFINCTSSLSNEQLYFPLMSHCFIPTSDQLLPQLLDGLQFERSEETWLLVAKHPWSSRTGRSLPSLKRPKEPHL